MASKQWKETPPGPEQRELEMLFENDLISSYDTPSKIQKANPLFMPFSAKVFAVHFRKTKAKFGKYAKTDDRHDDLSELGTVAVSELEPIKTQSKPTTIAPMPSQSTLKTSLFHAKVEDAMKCKNTPYVTWIYTDHIKNCDIVCVAACVISGSREINFVLSEDGTELEINYVWPSALYSAEELFHEKLNNNDLSIDHPKIHAFKSRLLSSGLTYKSTPQGSMTIPLPTKVLREVGSWKKTGIKVNDTKIVMLEFQAYQKEEIIEDADTSISFD